MEDLSLGFDKHDDTVQIIKTLTSSIWPLALLLCLSACAPMGRPIGGGGGGSDPFAGGSRPAPQDIELRVRNLNFNDARLYAVSGGSRRRLGQVSALSDETLKIPWAFTDRLRIEIDLVTGPRCLTREFMVDPGEILELQIESRFDGSGLCR
ncbi:MAG: hypothetical protein MK237_09250 [Gemmatimonadetes bacterium]|nr:hypothetical protein [Gemmatimonadota bacterium]